MFRRLAWPSWPRGVRSCSVAGSREVRSDVISALSVSYRDGLKHIDGRATQRACRRVSPADILTCRVTSPRCFSASAPTSRHIWETSVDLITQNEEQLFNFLKI